MVVTSDATIRRIGTRIPEIHFFRSLEDTIGDRRIFTAFGNASGIGDINLRAKATLKRTSATGSLSASTCDCPAAKSSTCSAPARLARSRLRCGRRRSACSRRT